MRKILAFLLSVVLFVTFVLPAFSQPSESAYDAVDPFIGTGADGNTFPGATLPFGMIQWSPDTRADGWYHFGDKTTRGFSLTHISGAGCPIYGDVPILPLPFYAVTEHANVGSRSNELELPFTHESEQAHPGYYSVEAVGGATTELTVTERAGIARFSRA